MRMKMASRALIGAALVVALTGCFKIDMDLTVNSDDTVDGTLILALEREAAGRLGMSEEQVSEELQRDLSQDLPEGGRAEPYADERFIGARVTLDDVTLEELNEGSGTEDLNITRQGDTFVVSGQLDLTEEELNTGDLAGFGDLADSVETQVRITFPGEVTETNGELSNDDRTVTWHPQVGEVNEISAVADADSSGGGVPGWVWPLVGIAAIVVAGLVFLNMRKREPAEPTDVRADETSAAGWTTSPAATEEAPVDADRVDDTETRDLDSRQVGTVGTTTATMESSAPSVPRHDERSSAAEEAATPETEQWPEARDRPIS